MLQGSIRRLESSFWRCFIPAVPDQSPGYFRETGNDQVMEKVDDQGRVLGFSVLRVSAVKERPLDVAL